MRSLRQSLRKAGESLEFLSPTYDGPSTWLWFVGLARLATILFVAAGSFNLAGDVAGLRWLLGSIYTAAFASGLWYLVVLRLDRRVSAVVTWTQMVVDFALVAATISCTGGQNSFFTFLLVVVILEAGVLMGLLQGFVFASLALGYMGVLLVQSMDMTGSLLTNLTQWYNYLIQGIVFFFTAFISGYWNQRISRLKHFQREILDNMNSGFLIADQKGLVIGVNRAACGILGLHAADVTGRHVEGIMRPETGAECPVMTALRLDKDFTSYEFHVCTTTDESKLLGLTTNRIRDAHGHVTGIIASFTDLTEMSRMRRELQQQDRMAVIGELSAGLAHEIRNPVASIRGAVEELRGSLDGSEMELRLANIAIRESDHLNEIVSGFLDFARDPSRRHLEVDLTAMAQEVRDQLLWKYGGGALIVNLTLPQEPCRLMGDPTQLKQVFMNLGKNAVEAMGGAGLLEIAVVQPDNGPIEVRFDDEGPGIEPDKIARIFEPFYTEKDHGVGMGLAVCMRIITAHDGTIQAASRSGGGTSMLIRLPRKQQQKFQEIHP